MTTDPANGYTIPVSHTVGGPYSAAGYTQGVLWVNVDSEWNDLQDVYEKVKLPAQAYCNYSWMTGCEDGCENMTGYCKGLPPGPHATNNFSLMIWPIPCVGMGEYSNSIYVEGVTAYSWGHKCACCQDHREPYYPGTDVCIDPPQCYEEDRYLDFGMTRAEFRAICA